MINYLTAFLKGFFFSIALAIPYIGLLYRFNIRRLPKVDLENLLPGRKIKMGTPIMGGVLIILPVMVLSLISLSNWKYLLSVIVVLVFGGIAGFIDEYVNTLGRTFKIVRKIRLINKSGYSLFPVPKFLLPIKKLALVPWKMFEEALRVMGSTQRGMKSHYKLLMHIFTIALSLYLVSLAGFVPSIWVPFLGLFVVPSVLYYLFVGFLMLGFTAAFGVTDGMDGLSAGTHTIAFMIFGLYAVFIGSTEIAIFSFLIVGAELAFLYFNAYPARLEMSDVGTVPLGMLFVLIAIFLHRELALVLVGIVFVVEILSSVIQQWSAKLRGKTIFLVAPIHHHFEKLGWHETKVVTRIWILGVVVGVLGFLLMTF